METIFIPDELENRLTSMFGELVPDYGKCGTLEGEMIRAVNRIAYRYYNDGDLWYDGYGCETCGPCVEFLCDFKVCPLADVMFKTITCATEGESYEKMLVKLVELVVDYVEGKNGQYVKNDGSIDMWSYDSRYKNYEKEEEYYYEGEDDEDY